MKYDRDQDYFLMCREWRVIRMRVLERDGAKCACCGRTAAHGVVMNVDHIKPRIRHPELALSESNLQVLCNECNHGKGNKFETDWRRQPPTVALPDPILTGDDLVGNELFLLGLLLVNYEDPEVLEHATSAGINPSHFYDKLNGRIYDYIVSLRDYGVPASAPAVLDAMRQDNVPGHEELPQRMTEILRMIDETGRRLDA